MKCADPSEVGVIMTRASQTRTLGLTDVGARVLEVAGSSSKQHLDGGSSDSGQLGCAGTAPGLEPRDSHHTAVEPHVGAGGP